MCIRDRHNTIPDITKKARKLIDGEWREVKVRDGEKIQQANIKIDEIRSGFTDYAKLVHHKAVCPGISTAAFALTINSYNLRCGTWIRSRA